MNPQRREVLVFMHQYQQNQLIQTQHILAKRRGRRRRRRRRVVRYIWVRDWIARKPQPGLYGRLMVELRNENPRAFQNSMMMPTAMYDVSAHRLTPALTKETSKWRVVRCNMPRGFPTTPLFWWCVKSPGLGPWPWSLLCRGTLHLGHD